MSPDPISPVPTVTGTVKQQLQQLASDASDAGEHGVALAALREFSKKPGVATTEFYLSIFLGVAGSVLASMPGKETIGALMASVAVLSYNLSRGMAKKAAAILLCALVGLSSGCTANGKINADAIEPTVTIVTKRDDAYLDADATLTPADRATKKRDNELLRKVVAEAIAAEHPPVAGK